jgi:hypothetical protein
MLPSPLLFAIRTLEDTQKSEIQGVLQVVFLIF